MCVKFATKTNPEMKKLDASIRQQISGEQYPQRLNKNTQERQREKISTLHSARIKHYVNHKKDSFPAIHHIQSCPLVNVEYVRSVAVQTV